MLRRLIYCLVCCSCLTAVAQVGDLPRSTPEAEGVSDWLVRSCYNQLTALPEVDLHHFMMLRHGKVIAEWHAAPYQTEQLHTLYSASKTVTAMAVGLAVDDGLLTVDDKVSKHLRDKMPATLSSALDSLTVRNLLMMAAGREPDLTIPEGEADWLTAWFAGDFSGVGQRFIYDSMCTHALAMIVTRVTGQPMLDYVRGRIFTPLHITEADWELAPDSVETAGWGLRLQTESEAKLGQFMLQQGKWNGQQLLSKQWMHDMTQRLISTREESEQEMSWWDHVVHFFRTIWHEIRSWFTGYNIDDYYLGYGYQTKAIQHPRAECYFAAGYGGQLIYVVPSLDIVVVINGRAANYGDELNTLYYQLVEPMLDEEQTIKATPVVPAIEMPRGEATHPAEQLLLNNTIVLDENLLGLQSIEVTRQGDDCIFTMTDKRGPLRAVAACGEWRITTGDERPIYIMECREQLVGTQRPFTSAAAYAWQGDTLALRLDWLDGGDNRRLKIHLDGNNATVIASDNFDPLLTDTIHGELGVRS
ncbi:MAG: serine hydrolase [Muribaculaceae bacterium]|nr:serine hydrolase [Muribaculaceae bacterium]